MRSKVSVCSEFNIDALSLNSLYCACDWHPGGRSPSACRKTGSIVRKLPVNLSLWNCLLLDRQSILVVWPGSLFLYLFFNIFVKEWSTPWQRRSHTRVFRTWHRLFIPGKDKQFWNNKIRAIKTGGFGGGEGGCLGNRQTQTRFVQWCYCLDWVWNHSSTRRRLPWAQAWSASALWVCSAELLCVRCLANTHTPCVKHYMGDMTRCCTSDGFRNSLRTSCLYWAVIKYLQGTSSYQDIQWSQNSVVKTFRLLLVLTIKVHGARHVLLFLPKLFQQRTNKVELQRLIDWLIEICCQLFNYCQKLKLL